MGSNGCGVAVEKTENEIPERRAILLETLKSRGIGIDIHNNPLIEERKLPAHTVTISHDCALCYDCGVFCPTGALKRIEEDAGVRIDFNASLCMGCYECAELCPEGAMRKEKHIDLNEFLNPGARTLFKKSSADCPSCGRRFFPENGREECTICEKKNNADNMAFRVLFKSQILEEDKLF
jgi:formate hydrogenlyase subunit 6/NADH:ubiquinone oxidoreductase subunit I